MLFALKLTLVPVFIAGVTLGSRRWGPRIGGWLNAVPMVAGPALVFLAIEQGAAFASRAALNTLAGLIGVATFSLAYGWAALRRPWWIALATGWAAFAGVPFVLPAVPWQPWAALGPRAAAFGLAGRSGLRAGARAPGASRRSMTTRLLARQLPVVIRLARFANATDRPVGASWASRLTRFATASPS